MYKFKNFALQRYHKNLHSNIVSIRRGEVGGYSIEIETEEPKSYDSYVYNGKSAEQDREFDLSLLEEMLKKSTE